MSCNCNNIYPNEDLKRWSVCQSIDILENYYTKGEVDAKIADIEVDADLSNYYTKGETNTLLDNKLDASAYTPTDLSGYATQEWVNNQGYLTQHQPLKTINGQSLIGNGNITISGGGSADLSNYYNKQEVDDKLDLKANASDVLSNVQVSPNGSGNYTWLNTYKNGTVGTTGYFGKINGTPMASRFQHEVKNMSLVETSAITTSLTSTSTDAQVPSAKATYDALNLKANASDLSELNTTVGQLSTTVENKADSANVYTKTEVNNLVNNKFACMTQAEYDALTNKENDVLYLIY